MKKSIYIITLLNIVLCFVQCSSNFEIDGVSANKGYQHVCVNAGFDDLTRIELNSSGNQLTTTWSEGDELYVFSSTGYLGNLRICNYSSSEPSKSAYFQGELSAWTDNADMYFYYFGKNATETFFDTADCTFSLDISTQDGYLNTIQNTLHFCKGVISGVASGTRNFNVTLGNVISIAKFDFQTNFGENPTITCNNAINSAVFNLKTGAVTSSTTNEINLGENLENADSYYMVLIPGTTQMSFTNGTITKNIVRAIGEGKFYTADTSGAAIPADDKVSE